MNNYSADVQFEQESFGHVFPVDQPDREVVEDCSESWDNTCNNGFDATGKILTHLLGNIAETDILELAAKDDEWRSRGVFRRFDQHEFVDYEDEDRELWNVETGLMNWGYVFYPTACFEDEAASCHIHFHLHGCGMRGRWINDETNFPNYAVSNNLIVVYPQVIDECFDNEGYSGTEYDTTEGVQPQFFQKVIERLQETRTASWDYAEYNIVNDEADEADMGEGEEGGINDMGEENMDYWEDEDYEDEEEWDFFTWLMDLFDSWFGSGEDDYDDKDGDHDYDDDEDWEYSEDDEDW
jgi:hypothetical protein